jgi:hypothetical protein
MGLVFLDCEAFGPCPSLGKLTEFGAVTYPEKQTFHGVLYPRNGVWVEDFSIHVVISSNLDSCSIHPFVSDKEAFLIFEDWLSKNVKGRPIMVSDNPAYDFQWINDSFRRLLGRNPFGHSARRLSDFYAGLCNNFFKTQEWKSLRITKHNHNPVHDSMGNLEGFERMLAGER